MALSPPRPLRFTAHPTLVLLGFLAVVLAVLPAGTPPQGEPGVSAGARLPAPILSVLPAGPTGVRNSVAVVFDRPMVPMGAPTPSHREGERYFRIRPRPEGSYRWIGTRTLSYVVPGRLPVATRFVGTVRAGAEALDGTSVVRAYEWSFNTPGPKLTASRPRENESHVRPDDWLLFAFDQPVAPRELARQLHLKGVTRWVVQAADSAFLASLRDPFTLYETAQVVAARPEPPLPLDTGFELWIDESLTGRSGPIPMGKEVRIPFKTYGPLEFRGWHLPRILGFSNDVEPESLLARMTLSPDPGGVEFPGRARRGFTFNPPLAESTRVTLSPDLRDIYGQRLGTETSILITYPRRHSLAFIPGQAVLPLDAPRRAVIWAEAGDSITVRATRISVHEAKRYRFPSRNDVYRGTWDFTRTYSGTETVRDTLDLTALVPEGKPGIVLLRAEGEFQYQRPLEQWGMLVFTDLALVSRMSPGGGVAWIGRWSDLASLPGARLSLQQRATWSRWSRLWSGTSDADGLAELPALPGRRQMGGLLLLAETTNDAMLTALSTQPQDLDRYRFAPKHREPYHELRAFLFGDRPIYRPGDTLRVGGLVRQATDAGWDIPDMPRVRAHLNFQSVLIDTLLPLDADGGFHLEWPIPVAVSTGRHSVSFRPIYGNAFLGSRTVDVEEYRAPSFTAKVQAGPEDLFPGDAVTSHVTATFYFGAPVAEGEVDWTVTSIDATYRDPLYPRFSFSDPRLRSGGQASPFSETRSLSAAGTVDLARTLPELPSRFQLLVVEAQVLSPAGDGVAARDTLRYHPGGMYPGARIVRWSVTKKDTVSAELIAVDPVTGEPLAGRVLDIEWRRILRWNYHRGVWASAAFEDSLLDRFTVTSGSEPVPVHWMPPEPGTYWLRVRATDDRGHTVTAGATFWVAGRQWLPRGSRPRRTDTPLDLMASEKIWNPGDTLQVVADLPASARRALVTVERERVLDARVVDVLPGSNRIDVPVRGEYRPNAFVRISTLDTLAAWNSLPDSVPDSQRLPSGRDGVHEFLVETESRHLRVNVETDRAAYAPGDTVRLTTRVLYPDGRGRPSWICAMAVDRGVLALMPPEHSDPFPSLYALRSLEVGGTDSRDVAREMLERLPVDTFLEAVSMRGGRSHSISFTGVYRPETRKVFATTCLWAPGRRTDANGEAGFSFVCPDNLTEFHVTVIAAAEGDRFGMGTSAFRVHRPLAVEPALPRFLRAEDRTELAALVVNDSGREVSGTVEVHAPGLRIDTGTRKRIRLQPGEMTRVGFPARLSGLTVPDTSRVTFTALADGFGDVVETPLPLAPLQVPRVTATAGRTRSEGREAIRLPRETIPGTGVLDVTLASSALAGADRAFGYLRDYPYGCLEQLSSQLLGLVFYRKLVEPAPGTLEADVLDAAIRSLIHDLNELCSDGGSFTLWPGWQREASPYLNAYAFFALLAAHQAGYDAGPALKDAVEPLRSAVAGMARDDYWSPADRRIPAGWILFVLDEAGKAGIPVDLRPEVHEGAESHFDDFDEENRLFAALALRGSAVGDSLLHGEAQRLWNDLVLTAGTAFLPSLDDPWIDRAFRSPIRATALTLLLTVAAGDEEYAARLVAGLLEQRRDGHWINTQDNALALWALTEYRTVFEASRGDLLAAAALPDLGLEFQETLPRGGDRIQHRFGVEALAAEATTHLVFENRGESGTLFYSGVLRWDEDPRFAAPRENGLTLERRVQVLPVPGETRIRPRVGDLVVVSLIVGVPEETHYLAIRDPLAAGLEPIIQRLLVESRERGRTFASLPLTFDPLPTSHLDLRDREVRIFTDSVPAGIYEVRYLARARTAGTFTEPPATVEAMYAPEQNGATAPGIVTIDPPEDQ